MSDAIKKEVCSFIVENFLFGATEDAPAADDSFLELGYIDSTAVLELVYFLEESYKIKIADDELIPDNLDSLTKIAQFVERKLKG